MFAQKMRHLRCPVAVSVKKAGVVGEDSYLPGPERHHGGSVADRSPAWELDLYCRGQLCVLVCGPL